ncbi:DUF2274 domain-containing protein [Phenylobacterium sp. SCN 70-31]|uniref:DUF2274 domain-containing protein n=1 Tax=Phenylobacterium sp. SCN 70-31 TaxID=1660129 RepID=UPI00086AEB1D|nr:DUF2274 domain-containing protein [Phenylobacterium sp. SCN 70-31]ODT84948.1 MAG: hypothetical protein ABS78_21900 [Phenylobacterium sp. SCN 70-31]
MAREAKTSLALPKIDTEEKMVDLRLKLKGKAAVDLAEYQAAYAEENGAIELDILAAHILATFIEGDKGFQAWRRARGGERRP